MAEHWLRLWHGTATDPKFRMVARDASSASRNVTPCHAILSVWLYLLETASQNTPRGSLDGLDVEVMAFTLDMDTDMASAIVSAMNKRGLIVDNSLSGWEKRQPKREDEGAAERKRKSREAARSHAESHTVTTEEKRGEEKRVEKKDQKTPRAKRSAGPEFDSFWLAYPRKAAKPKASDAWAKINPDPQTVAAIMSGLQAAKASPDWNRDGGQFIPYPASWLNARRWEDSAPQAIPQVHPLELPKGHPTRVAYESRGI